MIAIADNPAVTNPRKALTSAQQDALCAIGFYKNQRPQGSIWVVGNKRFSVSTIATLKKLGLLSGHARGVWPTQAGKLAIDKLKGETQ